MQKIWLSFAQILAALVLVLAALFVLDRVFPGLLPPRAQDVTIREVEHNGSAPLVSTFADAARKSLPSVVNINTSQQTRRPRHPLMNDPVFRHFFGPREDGPPQRAANLGSGVIVSRDGYILTNNHVVEAADEIQVTLPDGRNLPAELVGTDPDTDLAVLRVGQSGLHPITFAKPDSLSVGDVVLAIGNPWGVGQTVTLGIVSALNRTQLGINTFENFIQTDAAINPGNSGGALVDASGHLVGINTAIFSRTGGNLGIGFAIPVSLARQVLEQIITHGTVIRGWVGVEVQDITPEIAESFSLKNTEGALIAGVLRGGPADRAGIRPGDVLVAVNGKGVADSAALLNLIAALPPGALANLQLIRKQSGMRMVVKVERRPVTRRLAEE
ncbi:MAG: Do family serine endopeptidase [Thiobacillaceae bacterium]|jgi:serine protease DegQ|nr:Do family serine endopeptidase [Thiobacillaceae bacterium]